jgi:DNA-nicking Smr family endonuclease
VKEAAPKPQHRLRRLSDEEIALWTEVARSVARRRGASLPTAAKPHIPATPAAPAPSPVPALEDKLAKARPPPLAPIERRLKRDLKRGRGAIDGALDLHGMTQAEAHQALRGFLRHSQARGARLVIVVTGKGGPLDALGAPGHWAQERGVLRRLAPHWLREPDLRAIVLGFEEAGRAHGGSGALYVRLRRG